jgi:hypothetical protein
MLSREVMGLLALAILWVNTLLVVGAGGQELVRLVRRLRRMRPLVSTGEGLLQGRVVAGGTDGVLAVHRVEQVGRYAADDADRRAIAFSDRSYVSQVLGGVVETEAGAVRVAEIGASASVEVWPARAVQRRAAACASSVDFDRAYADARKARGFTRTLESALSRDDRVFLFGALRRDDGGDLHLSPAADGSLLVSAIDPRAFCRGKAALVMAFLFGALVAAAVCTVLALQAPLFGTVSTLGAALGLAYFLLIQPAGTALRDAVRVPSAAIVRGNWIEGAVDDASASNDPDAAQAA